MEKETSRERFGNSISLLVLMPCSKVSDGVECDTHFCHSLHLREGGESNWVNLKQQCKLKTKILDLQGLTFDRAQDNLPNGSKFCSN